MKGFALNMRAPYFYPISTKKNQKFRYDKSSRSN
jgi:hypothetical protein